MGFFRGPNTVRDGLVFVLDAGNIRSYIGSGGSAVDLVSKLNATLSHEAIGTTSPGSFVFNGSSNKISFELGDPFDAPFTLEVFWKTDAATRAAYEYTAKIGSETGVANTVASISKTTIGYGGGDGIMYSYDGTTPRDGPSIATTEWYHGILVCNTGSPYLEFYLNGVAETIANTTAAINTNGSMTIGVWNTTWWLDGQIPLVRVYNKSLTALEVLQNYDATKTRFNLE
jgi:hypothetical protein